MTRRRRAPTVIALSLALGLGLSGVVADSATRAATLVFSALADAYTASAAPSTNYGSATSLRVKDVAGGKAFRTYLRFDVAGVSGPVTSATLSLWVTDASDRGGAVHLVPGTWGEASITWANAPAHDAAVVGQLGPVVRRQWVDISLDGVIVADGSYGLVVDGMSTDLAVYGSRESGRPARLTVVTGASPTPTPSPTLQPTPSPTPSPDPTPSPSPSPTPTPDPTPSPSPSPSPSPIPTPDPTPSPSASPSPASTIVVCDGDPDAAPLKLDGGVYADPSVLKVIRGCTFDHIVGSHAIRLRNARNVLIEDNRFADIHSGLVGQGQHAIAIPGGTLADGIVVRHNTFTDIGGDGLQLADAGRLVTNIVIEDNTFVYLTDRTWLGGENAIDVKGVGGPVSIRANFVSGYRPCDGTTMECSGSQGVGITLHAGSASGRATAVTLDGNTFVDNTIGLSVTEADDTSIVNDMFVDQLSTHVYVSPAAAGCVQSGNSFIGPALIDWGPCL